MSRSEFVYLVPYFISLGLSSGIFVFAWRRQHSQVKGTRAYLWVLTGESLWILAYILQLLSPEITQKLFWDGFEWIMSGIAIISFPVFAVQFAEQEFRYSRYLFLLSLVVPVLFSLLVLTDNTFHSIRIDPFINHAGPLAEVTYDLTTFTLGYFFYALLTSFIGIGFLFYRLLQPHFLFRAQVITIIAGVLIPLLGGVLSISGIKILPWQDPMPMMIALSNPIIAWGLFRYRIFDISPIGRDKVFEAMIDPVVILDNHNNVIDINQSMLDLMGQTAESVIGQPAKVVFNDFPIPIKLYTSVSYAQTEATFEIGNKTVYYEMTVWPLFNSRHEMISRLYISHDITALKELEGDLRKLNNELERRVQERTQELAASYDYTLEGWAKALELRDKETEGHSRRVTETTVKVARALDIPENEIDHIRRGAILHDIGKMAVPDEILLKASSLTEDEREIIQQHPITAYQLLERIPYLHSAIEIPYCHHEHWDGSGYPRGLKEREIPIAARIFAVADVWDALRSERPYSKEWSKEDTIAYLIKQAGKQFDPGIVNVFLELVDRGEI